MNLRFLYPHWGSESLRVEDFLKKVLREEFDGIEINIPKDALFETYFYDQLQDTRLKNPEFFVVAQQVSGVRNETADEYLKNVLKRLESLVHYRPNFINSHTGKDHFTFDENCKIIEEIENFSEQNRIPVYHEIHRGRFTFHAATTLRYLNRFPSMKLVGDLSHWCVVSESMLQDQESIIAAVVPHIHHIHARVGFEQAPQVNHPFAPEWQLYLETYLKWWQQILDFHKEQESFTITPEFGPYPYMPQEPFSKKPLAIQSDINIKMRDYLKETL